jgi:DNA-binding transcriptional LysR family regulator
MDLNPVHVRTLAAVARHGSFSRAAERLHLSQPAVSLHVRALEERLGVAVLARAGRRPTVTRAGAVLLAHAGRAFAELAAAEHAVRALRGVVAGAVRLGTGATASIYLLPARLGTLRRRYPGIELALVTGNSAEIVAGVAAGDLDAGVVTLPVAARRLAVTPFFTDRLVAIAPRDDHAPAASIEAGALARHPLILYERGGTIRRVIDAWFRRARVTPRVAMELGDAEAIKRLVAAGLGWAVTSAVAVDAERRARSLRVLALRPPLARQLGIVRRRAAAPSPALDAVLRAIS